MATTTKLLIIASLTLLAVFEFFWLRQMWREQYERLQQNTDYLFQQSVAALQDSLVRQSMSGEDSILNRKGRFRFKAIGQTLPDMSADSAVRTPFFESKANIVVRMDGDSGMHHLRDTVDMEYLQIFVVRSDQKHSGSGEGLDRLLLNLPEQIRQLEGKDQVFRIEKNTIPIRQLEKAYQKNLRASGIPLAFEIITRDSLPIRHTADGIYTQPAVAGLLIQRFYAAVFPRYQGYLLRQMLPSLAFAFLLFGTTAAAFVLIYRSLREQQRLTKLKNEFISNITHELKTPITTVGVALEALSDFEALRNPDKTREYLAHSKLELERLSLLVEKVLRLSMFEEQEARLKLEALDLAALTRQVVAAMQLQAERSGALIQVELPEQQDFSVAGDRLHLSSVIFNLIDNALKYTADRPLIRVSMEKAAGQLVLRVQDNGIGIPPEYQSKVFDKFFRMPGGDRHDVKGHGLGLSYAAQVVRQHGGSISVESRPGEGSLFTVVLPGI